MPRLSVVVCTLNGGEQLRTCLTAVRNQSIGKGLQLVVVDDGSRDGSADLAAQFGADVIRHPTNRGLAAARNTGLGAARSPITAFVDDDCEPEPQWAERLLGNWPADAIGLGGPVLPVHANRWLHGYLERNNPLEPLEIDLATSATVAYRFVRYLLRNARSPRDGSRPVYSLVGANMAFQTAALRDIGGFDEHFRFGAEETELCLRLADHFGSGCLQLEPSAVVRHHFDDPVSGMLRRHRAYGVGTARLYRKRSDLPLTIFPFPMLLVAVVFALKTWRGRLLAAMVLPQVMLPRGVRNALRRRGPAPLLDCYLRLAEEASTNVGYLAGLWRFRDLAGRPAPAAD